MARNQVPSANAAVNIDPKDHAGRRAAVPVYQLRKDQQARRQRERGPSAHDVVRRHRPDGDERGDLEPEGSTGAPSLLRGSFTDVKDTSRGSCSSRLHSARRTRL